MTRAIILAAGRGSRMGALTGDKPKCLTPLAGRPLLEWQLNALRTAGINDIAIVTGYKGELLDRPDLHRFENVRWNETNMVMSLVTASAWLRTSECIVSYSDIVYGPSVIKTLIELDANIGITYDPNWLDVWRARFADPLSDAETFRIDKNGRLTEIGARASSLGEIAGQYMGLLKFTPQGWGLIESYLAKLAPEQRDKTDMTTLLRGLLINNIPILTAAIIGKWFEIDSESDLNACEATMQSHKEGYCFQ